MNKNIQQFLMILFLILSFLSSCNVVLDTDAEDGENAADHDESDDIVWDEADIISVVLNKDSITTSSTTANVNGGVLTITKAGTYEISGSLTDGQLIVNTKDDEVVRLILNGVNINCSSSSPIYIMKAKKVIIVLSEFSENYLTDGSSYTYTDIEKEEPSATMFSKSDLTIYGKGSLYINSNFNDAISSKDGLVIKSGTIFIDSIDDGIRGKDYIVIENGNITVTAAGDGLKSDNETDASKGYITINCEVLSITSGSDAIQAQTSITINSGDISITTGGGSGKSAGTTSTKGIKGLNSININGGIFDINSADDAIHSNGNIIINDGTFTISSGDDGIHSDNSLTFNGGNIEITKSYEGIESGIITINKGYINITASDDGVNVAGGTDSSSLNGRPGENTFSTSDSYFLYINGGYITVNSTGDGIDVNGSIIMTGGTVLVDGPTDNGNGPMDYDGSFTVSNGFIIATGSSGMAQAPSTTSSQYSILLNFTSARSAESLVNFQTTSGEEMATYKPAKKYQSVLISSPLISNGVSYAVYIGGSSSGTEKDGLYTGGIYSGGTKYTTITISNVVTTIRK